MKSHFRVKDETTQVCEHLYLRTLETREYCIRSWCLKASKKESTIEDTR